MSSVSPPKNPNYCATVVRVQVLDPLEGCDNLLGLPMFGYQAIVDKQTEVGQLGVVFPAETQLAEDFVRANNLYRHNTFNADPTKKGYLEDNRRVKAIRLRNQRSDALFMPLDSLAYTGFDLSKLREGDDFDRLGEQDICQKYARPFSGGQSGPKPKNPRLDFERVMGRYFPEHFDTTNYFRTRLDPDTPVVITQKLHGTSVRVGNVPVLRKLRLLERLASRVGVKVQPTEYAYVYGSHHVVKDADSPHVKAASSAGWYGEDLWTAEGRKLAGLLPQGFIVYGELIGWTGQSGPIQKGYTYDVAEGQARLHVYRVSYVSPSGEATDLSWPQLKEFCRLKGLEPVREMYAGPLGGFDIPGVLDQDFRKLGYDTVPIATTSACDEGVCVRIEGIRPTIVKAKSPTFVNRETRMIDAGEEDMEEAA